MSEHRRNFLRVVGGLIGANALAGEATAATPGDAIAANELQSLARRPVRTAGEPLNARAAKALQIRVSAAQAQSERPAADARTNGDEDRYPNKIASFTKGLPHSQLGEVDLAAYQTLLKAYTTGSHADAENIQLGFGRKFVNLEASFAFDLAGGDSHTFNVPPPPAFSSAEMAAEMVEMYWHALARDVPFSQWDTSPIIQNAAAELDRLPAYKGPRDAAGRVTTANVFRGTPAGNNVGPYLSQYALQTINFGSTPREQTYRTGVTGYDYATDYGEWVLGQGGLAPYRLEFFDPTYRYVRNGRDLAQFVHWDYACQVFLQAALIIFNQCPETILNFNLYQLSRGSPYKASRKQTPFVTFGAPNIQAWLAQVSVLVLKPTWYHKWLVHRRLRPETFGGRIHNTLIGAANYPIHSDVLNSQGLRASVGKWGNSLLSQAYVESCPLHPSYPAGHAAIAGACVTILKAFFDETSLVSGSVTPSDDGLSLIPADSLFAPTIGGELNKLAYNVAQGRDFAGIHYRSDGDAGLALGEEVAIAFLQGEVNTFSEAFQGFTFTKFDGTKITIAPS